jgi:protein-L-isoaspartate(D-aspartate) O-methyltransferase
MTETDKLNQYLMEQRARLIMLLRGMGIRDKNSLSAIEYTPREAFVPQALHQHAYDNVSLPIRYGQTISQPFIVALMTAHLELTGKERVLEIGTGSGYQAAVLSHICRRVYTIERIRPLLVEAERRFKQLKLTNITSRLADGQYGWPEAAPFDRVIVTCGASEIPLHLLEQIKDDGIMVIPVDSENGDQILKKVTWNKNRDAAVITDIMDVRFVPLLPDIDNGES